MAIDTTAGAAPVFLGLPLITKDADTAGDIICSDTVMQSLRNRLYQLDPTAPCASVNSTGTETIVAGFYVGTAQQSQSVDCFFILNMTLLKFKIEYSNDNGATYTLVTGTDFSSSAYTGGADFVIFLASPITANKVRLTMYDTTNKSIGTFNCALTTFQAARPASKLVLRPTQTRKEVKLADGTTDQTYFEWSDNSFTLYEIDSEFDYMTTANKTSFENVLLGLAPFLYYPEPGDNVRGIYLSTFKLNTYQATYEIFYKGRGYKIKFSTTPLGYV